MNLHKYLDYLNESILLPDITIGVDLDRFINKKSDKLLIVGLNRKRRFK